MALKLPSVGRIFGSTKELSAKILCFALPVSTLCLLHLNVVGIYSLASPHPYFLWSCIKFYLYGASALATAAISGSHLSPFASSFSLL